MTKKRLEGTVTSNKMQKTIVVEVEMLKTHPLYRKKYRIHKKYKAHVENEKEYQIGDKVVIEECRPISKEKKWRVIKKVS